MGYLKSKSNKLSESADLLHANQLYHAVPHCSYYACFQLLLHICKDSLGLDRKAIWDLNKDSHEGSHGFTINQVLKYIESQNEDDSRKLNNNIPLLKKLRMRADYEDTEIMCKDSLKAINLSKTIVPVLDQYCQ